MSPPSSYGNGLQSKAGKPLGTAYKNVNSEARPITSNKGAMYGVKDKKNDSFYNSKTKLTLDKG